MPPEKLEALLFMCRAVIERYLTNAIDTFNDKYGSVGWYLRDELNVGKTETEELKQKYL